MGYTSGNAAFAYDMQPEAVRWEGNLSPEVRAPEQAPRPRLDVLTGAGREAAQTVSPAFMSVIKTFCALALIFCVVGAARVTIASMTSASLNANAALSNEIEQAATASTDLEVRRSVFGSTTRIRDFALMRGMVDSSADSVTIDVSTPGDAAAAAPAQTAMPGAAN